jgi:DnaJ like chaperone protein
MTIWQRITGLAASLSETCNDGAPPGVQAVQSAAAPGVALTASRDSSGDGRQTVAFTMAVIALGAKMAKADGIVSPIEVEAFYQVFKTDAADAVHVAKVFELAQRDIAGFETYATQIRGLLGGDELLLRSVLESLFFIASADRALHPGEDHFLKTVAARFGLSDSTYRHVRAQFVEDDGAPYDVLGLDPSVSDADLKVRHRKLVRENHPDLLMGRGLPPEMIEVANRKLAAINAAYATLMAERSL